MSQDATVKLADADLGLLRQPAAVDAMTGHKRQVERPAGSTGPSADAVHHWTGKAAARGDGDPAAATLVAATKFDVVHAAYKAPELLGTSIGIPGKEDTEGHQQQQPPTANMPSDVYAFGVLLLELMSGTEAWRRYDEASRSLRASDELDKFVMRHDGNANARALVKLVQNCLLQTPSARPSSTELMERLSLYES